MRSRLSDYVQSKCKDLEMSLEDFCDPQCFNNPITDSQEFEEASITLSLAKSIFKKHFRIARKLAQSMAYLYDAHAELKSAKKLTKTQIENVRDKLKKAGVLPKESVLNITSPPSILKPKKRVRYTINASKYCSQALENAVIEEVSPILTEFDGYRKKHTFDLFLMQSLEKNIASEYINEFDLPKYLRNIMSTNEIIYVLELVELTSRETIQDLPVRVTYDRLRSELNQGGVLADTINSVLWEYMSGGFAHQDLLAQGYTGALNAHFAFSESGAGKLHVVLGQKNSANPLPNFDDLMMRILETSYGTVRYEATLVELLSPKPAFRDSKVVVDEASPITFIADENHFSVITTLPYLQRRNYEYTFSSEEDKRDFVDRIKAITQVFDSYFKPNQVGFVKDHAF